MELPLIIYVIGVRNMENTIGITNARNLGYKTSKGDFITFTNADCELDPLWTKKMQEKFNYKINID